MDEFGSFIKTVGGGEGDRCKYPTRLDMYGCGCQHNCQYCYARSLLEFRNLWNPDSPRSASRDKVRPHLDNIPEGTIVRLGGMTDPFQPLESQLRHTEWLIGELNDRNIGYLIVTKSARVLDCKTLDKDLAHIQISYTHSEGRAPKDFECASPPRERLEAVSQLYGQGYDVAIRLSPFIPKFVDMKQVVASPCDKIVVEFLRVNTFIKRKLPSLSFTDWRVKYGGYQHMSINRKMEYLQPLIGSGKQITVCEDFPKHYDWFREHINANKDDCCNLRL